MTAIELDPSLLVTLQALESNAVEYVLVGEVAQAIHNGGGYISGVSIVPGGYGRNVDRLAKALKGLRAKPGGGGDLRNADLRQLAPCTLRTSHADIELDFEPGGTAGYPDLYDDASRVALANGVEPLVASPGDLERIDTGSRSSRRATRPKVPPTRAPRPAAATGPPPPAARPDEDPPPARAPEVLPPEPATPREESPTRQPRLSALRLSRASARRASPSADRAGARGRGRDRPR